MYTYNTLGDTYTAFSLLCANKETTDGMHTAILEQREKERKSFFSFFFSGCDFRNWHVMRRGQKGSQQRQCYTLLSRKLINSGFLAFCDHCIEV